MLLCKPKVAENLQTTWREFLSTLKSTFKKTKESSTNNFITKNYSSWGRIIPLMLPLTTLDSRAMSKGWDHTTKSRGANGQPC